MSGPSYPRPPGPGSNAIGRFEIGISPIGSTIPAFDVWDTIMSQYANSPILTGLILAFNAAADQTANIDEFFDNVWDIRFAQGAGLDVWGRIVGVSRILLISTITYFGFEEALPGSGPFNTRSVNQGGGTFFAGTPGTSNFRLEDNAYRTLILAKAAFNITNCSIPAINQLLLNLFPNRGNCFVTEGPATMFMTYNFNFALTAVELAIVTQSGVLPKPTGVHASIIVQGVTVVP